MADRPVLELLLGDIVRLRKPHACGTATWRVERLGADIGLRCVGCRRRIMLERVALERRIVGFDSRGDAALAPSGRSRDGRRHTGSGRAQRAGGPAQPPVPALWLSQLATQVGGNMVVFGLTVIIHDATGSSSAVALLLLTFLVPAVLFSAVAGVYVDRIDRRVVLLVTNVLRAAAYGAMFVFQDNLAVLYLLNFVVATVTVFFAPAEAAMIPSLVPRQLLLRRTACSRSPLMPPSRSVSRCSARSSSSLPDRRR